VLPQWDKRTTMMMMMMMMMVLMIIMTNLATRNANVIDHMPTVIQSQSTSGESNVNPIEREKESYLQTYL
jgi:hypothetical protein